MKKRTGETNANMAASHSSWRPWPSKDEHCLIGPDRVDKAGEQRWWAIGGVRIEPKSAAVLFGCPRISGGLSWRRSHPHHLGAQG